MGNKPIYALAVSFVLLLIAYFLPIDSSFTEGQHISALTSHTPTNDFSPSQIRPLPLEHNENLEKAALGESLFQDPRLSTDNTISCAVCHNLNQGGTDNRTTSIGVAGSTGEANAPTVFNSSFNFVQFWDGRAPTLEHQVSGPIHNPIEMASNWQEVLSKLERDEKYHSAFTTLYPDGMTPENISDAIATFERTLITPNARFDHYLRGDSAALTENEKAGYLRFKEYGCSSCHQGINIGGNMYQRFGIMGNYFKNKKVKQVGLGRFNITNKEDDRHVFKVPSLRNVAVTAPYFHDGSIATIEEAVAIMGKYQLGRKLSDEDIRLITLFLSSLTGQWQGKTLQ